MRKARNILAILARFSISDRILKYLRITSSPPEPKMLARWSGGYFGFRVFGRGDGIQVGTWGMLSWL